MTYVTKFVFSVSTGYIFTHINFMALLTVGTVAFDAIETPFGKVDKIIGGSANYISWSAAHLCKPVQVTAVVGDDYPNSELEQLKYLGVDFSGLQIKDGEKSFFWSGKYDMNLNDRTTTATDLNVLANFEPIIPKSFQETDYVLLGNLTPAVQNRVLDQMTTQPKLIAMDTMNYWIQDEQYQDDLKKILQRVDVLIINEEEARMLGNNYSIVKSARIILESMGPKFVVVKKGEHGALLFHENNAYFAPALPLEDVFDPTGAGDSFAGGFMGYLAKTDNVSFENLKRAVIYGSVMASFCVEKFGPERLKELDMSQIEQRIQDFVDLVQVDIVLQE